jgi:hypothetical protein
MSDDETVELLARQLEDYLRQHPQAVDNLEGVAKSWFPRPAPDRLELVRRALELLVARGVAVQRRLPDGRPGYGAPPAPARVALIAVHGDQGPNETAREIARLLQRANPDAYAAFGEAIIDLPVAAAPRADTAPAKRAAPWYVQSPHVRKMASPGKTAPADIQFTASAIGQAEPSGKSSRYASIRLKSERDRADGRVALDVYELYWADLSRLSGVLAQVLGKFYQLLFHLASLGQKTVELAWLKERETPNASRALATVSFLQTMVEGLIGVVMPVLNLCFAAVVLPVMLLLASGTVRFAACWVAIAVLVGAGVYRALYAASGRLLGAWAPLLPPGVGALAGGAAALFLRKSEAVASGLYGIAVVGLFVIVWLLSSMLGERRRSDARVARLFNSLPKATALAGIALGAALSWIGWRTNQDTFDVDARIAQAIAFAADGVFYVLQVSWTLLLASGLLLTIGYLVIAVRAPRDLRGAAVKRALWTGHMGFFIPTTLFLIVTIIIWKALVHLVLRSIPPYTDYTPWLHKVLPGWLTALVGDLPTRLRLPATVPLSDYTQALLTDAAGAFFNLLFVMIAAAVVLLVVGLLPSIFAETSPPARPSAVGSRRLGFWLDDAFAGAKLAGWLVLLALVVVLPLGARPQVIDYVTGQGWTFLLGDSVATWIGGTIAGSIAALALFRRNVFGGLQKGLDIALDVDNWLRERPPSRNPRGLILLRFLALLREVQAGGYERIVIVSHSQGTVVCADLLRYLHTGNWGQHGLETLRDVPIRLLTFGSPLRQLYSRRFPHLYGWAVVPDAAALHVAIWVNGYRSGDYVGRYLWHADDADGRYAPTDLDAALAGAAAHADRRSEFCLGEGAHTHYFDESATPVGRLIDEFVIAR